MKGDILLVANDDADSNAIIAEAAKQTGRGLRKASSTQQAFEILSMGLNDVDLAIIDLDSGVHSLVVLRVIAQSETAPPTIALTSRQEAEIRPIAQRHGAAACVGKPFDAAQLASIIEEVCLSACQQRFSCDLSGHLLATRRMQLSRVCPVLE